MEKQKTIKKSIQFSGKGIHTGSFTNMTLLPAKENKGIVFIRTDKDNFEIKANIDFVFSTNRSTNLAFKNIHINFPNLVQLSLKFYKILQFFSSNHDQGTKVCLHLNNLRLL